jgi:hypothetical protein
MTTATLAIPRIAAPQLQPRPLPDALAQEKPVFVDPHGRRARWVRLVVSAAAVLPVAWMAALAVGLGPARLPALELGHPTIARSVSSSPPTDLRWSRLVLAGRPRQHDTGAAASTRG